MKPNKPIPNFFHSLPAGFWMEKIPMPPDSQLLASRLRENPQGFTAIAKAWEYTKNQYENVPTDEPHAREKNTWDQRSMDYYNTLSGVMWYGLPNSTLQDQSLLPEQDHAYLEAGPFGVIKKLLLDPKFESRDALIRFINYELWRAERQVQNTTNIADLHQKDLNVFNNKKNLLIPLLLEASLVESSLTNPETLRLIMTGLKNADAVIEASSLLCRTGLSDKGRLSVAVEYINTFGFIHTVDTVAAQIKATKNAPDIHQALLQLYGTIQGEETRAIAAELSDIYKKIDFSTYHLNNDERITAEADRLEQVLKELHGTEAQFTNIVDIGAGAGPHSLALRKRGYRNLAAFEYEQKHVDFIRSQDPEIPVVQGDWHNLNETIQHELPGKLPIEFAYSLGRTIAHNRTPTHMLHFFDEVHRALDSHGRFLFDVPDIDWGVYQERIKSLQNNLKAIGVDATRSRLVFDGPNDIDRFNRMILTTDQIQALAHILGYKVRHTDQEAIGEQGEIKNIYHLLEKDADWSPQSMSAQEFGKHAVALGLLDPGTNFHTYVEAWGMTIAQAFIFAPTCGIGNEYSRYLNEQKKGPRVLIHMHNEKPVFDLHGMRSGDWNNATACKGMSKQQMLNFIASEHPTRQDQTTPS